MAATDEQTGQPGGLTESSPLKLIKDAPREWQVLRGREAVVNLIENKLHRRSLYLKGTQPAAEFTPGEQVGDGIEFYCNPSLEIPKALVLFITLNRQLEIDFTFQETRAPGHVVLLPVQARIGAAQRAFPRYAIKDPELIMATNFRVSANKIAPNNTKLQITTQVIFPEFEKTVAAEMPGVRVLLVGDAKTPPELMGQTPHEATELTIGGALHYVQPVLVQDQDHLTLLALIVIPAPAGGISRALQMRAEELADDLLQKVIDANTSLIKDRQRVVNISEGGVALEIDNDILRKNLPLRDWFTFDLLFKMHAPIRFYGNIRHIAKKGDDLIVGIDLSGQGHSEYRKGTREVYRTLLQKLQRNELHSL